MYERQSDEVAPKHGWSWSNFRRPLIRLAVTLLAGGISLIHVEKINVDLVVPIIQLNGL